MFPNISQSAKRSIVTADVHRGFSYPREGTSLTLRHWSGVSLYTSTFVFAQTYVFAKQSLENLLLYPTSSAGTISSEDTSSFFAEFHKNCYSDHLSLLDQPTCVGLRYGKITPYNEPFLEN